MSATLQTTIASLTQGTTPLTGNELVPLWQNGKTVQVSASALGLGNTAPSFVTVANNFVVAISGQYTTLLAAGSLASGTVLLPANITHVRVASTQAVSGLTVADVEGRSVVGAPTFFPQNWAFEMSFNSSNNTWYSG